MNMPSNAPHTTLAAPAAQPSQFAEALIADRHEAPYAFLEPDTPRPADNDPDDEMSLFQWWRTRPAEDFPGADEQLLTQALAHTVILDEPRWAQARCGIFAPAIEIALPILPKVRAAPLIDLILSAILLCALRGDPRAAFVLILALRTLGYRAESPLPRGWRDAIATGSILRRPATMRGPQS